MRSGSYNQVRRQITCWSIHKRSNLKIFKKVLFYSFPFFLKNEIPPMSPALILQRPYYDFEFEHRTSTSRHKTRKGWEFCQWKQHFLLAHQSVIPRTEDANSVVVWNPRNHESSSVHEMKEMWKSHQSQVTYLLWSDLNRYFP